jgi:hypothetical protein
MLFTIYDLEHEAAGGVNDGRPRHLSAVAIARGEVDADLSL